MRLEIDHDKDSDLASFLDSIPYVEESVATFTDDDTEPRPTIKNMKGERNIFNGQLFFTDFSFLPRLRFSGLR